jgi:preprotein translocase subunit SecY
MRPGSSAQDIARDLEEQAAALWGRRRAQVIRRSLEQTAQQLWEVGRHLPERDLEPGFYQ